MQDTQKVWWWHFYLRNNQQLSSWTYLLLSRRNFMSVAANLSNYPWLKRQQNLEENLLQPFCLNNKISNYILNTYPYIYKSNLHISQKKLLYATASSSYKNLQSGKKKLQKISNLGKLSPNYAIYNNPQTQRMSGEMVHIDFKSQMMRMLKLHP